MRIGSMKKANANKHNKLLSTINDKMEPDSQEWVEPFDTLRKKWHEVPAINDRITTTQLIKMSDKDLLQYWSCLRTNALSHENYSIRGWYHTLYMDIVKDKMIMDVGSGLGIDSLSFAQQGARVTCVDIVESNLNVLKRLCALEKIQGVDFCYLENFKSLSTLPKNYDVIWCQGSLINAPFNIIHMEVQELLKHLPIGGRWIELAYPRKRWEREGKLPFSKWGELTDGIGTPWVEWYDLNKLNCLFEPAKFDVVFQFNFHNDDFNWFDLIRRS
jgi:2-polyprenyl-3-methyl-5-hydroxy-6-metoxy-1,4-benzoquinol methylase